MLKELERGSSHVDWCEANYSVTEWVAEFYNSISNVLFFLVPPLLIYLFRDYAKQVTGGVNIVWGLLIVVGAGSFYFHATLSLVGQLIDEISIIWVIIVALALWFPKRFMPAFVHQSRYNFKFMMLGFAVVSSGLACVMPEINHFVLFCLVLPCATLLYVELRTVNCARVYKLGMRSTATVLLALSCWLMDKFACEYYMKQAFPYLHCFWHILIFIGSYTSCVLFAYFDAIVEVPETKPTLMYWPKDSWQIFGIPYIHLKHHKSLKPTKASHVA